MMYDDFKKELYRNILRQRGEMDVTVRLFEGRRIYTDREGLRMIELINLASRGVKEPTVEEDMLCVAWGDRALVNMKYWRVRVLYERFGKRGWMGVLPGIVARMQEGSRKVCEQWSHAYEHNRKHHILRPLNYYSNRGDLENCIYWRFGDVALVLYDLMFETEEDCTTMKISREMTEEWGLPDEVLLHNALFNTRTKMPPRLFHSDDLRYPCRRTDGIFMPEDGPVNIQLHQRSKREGMYGYRLTTTRWINGAIALFYPYVKEQLAWMMDGDFYVAFPSIHEAVIHPVRHKVLSEMKAAILHTNVIFDEREMLTNRVYRYMSNRQELLEV